LDIDTLSLLTPNDLRTKLPEFLASFIGCASAKKSNHRRLTDLMSSLEDHQFKDFLHSLEIVGRTEQLYPADPTCRAVSRTWAHDIVSDFSVQHIHHLETARLKGPTIVLCNHLAYLDSTVTDAVLTWSGHEDLANQLVYLAGPKVYSHLFRRIGAAALGTILVPQSTSIAHTADLSPRELAKKAIASLGAAKASLQDQQVIWIYPEGSRNRTGHMGSFLRGVRRYLGVAGAAQVVPAAISGTEKIMPVTESLLDVAPVSFTFGAPFPVEKGGELEGLEQAYYRISELLEGDQRPPEDQPPIT
jgi:1-acyl-sn-glycerol-3-phosphate acyltransferase